MNVLLYSNRLTIIISNEGFRFETEVYYKCHREDTLRLARRKAIADTQRNEGKSWALWQLAAGCSKNRGCKLENLAFPASRDP
jgi:hypothetical protein